MSDDKCSYPRCRQSLCIILFSETQLCDAHWEKYCEIKLPDNANMRAVISYEKKKLRFLIKCGHKAAETGLKQLEQDQDNYVLQHVKLHEGAGNMTVAEYRLERERRRESRRQDAEDDLLFQDTEEVDFDGDPELAIADELDDFDESDMFGIND
jgi:hypothetical protein